MQQRLSKLEAAQRLGVSPSTLDRMIRRGELEIEREGRGDRAKVWVLAPGLSSDAPGGQPVDAGPSPEAELAAVREQVRALQELADYRGKLLDEAEWRYRELLQELRRSQTMLEGLTRALPPGGDGGVTPGMALVALRTGLDRFLAFPPQAGTETRCTTGPTSRRLLHPGPCGFGPAVPGGAGPRCRSAGAVVAPGRGSLDAIGCQGSSSFMLCPLAGGLSLNATTAEAVRLVQLRPDAGGCSRPPRGSWKSGRKAIGRLSRYAKQTYYSLIRHGNICNTFQ